MRALFETDRLLALSDGQGIPGLTEPEQVRSTRLCISDSVKVSGWSQDNRGRTRHVYLHTPTRHIVVRLHL